MKTKTWLPLLLFVSSIAGLQAKLPEHTRLLPPDMMGMVTLHPGQILSKMDHLSLINKPMVANLYCAGGPHEWIYELDGDDNKHALITGLFEKPAETTGIDLTQPLYLVANNMSKLQVQVFARLTDAKQFEKFALGMIEPKKKKWQKTKGGRRVLIENSQSLLAHDGNNLILTFTISSHQQPLIEIADQWFAPSESTKLPDFLVQQLVTSPDLGIYYPLAPILPFLAKSLEVGQQPPQYLKQTQLFLHANSAKGKIDATLHVHTGKQQDLQLQSKPLGKEILGFLEQSSLLHVTASLNLETVMEHLRYLLPFLGMDQEELGDEILEEFNIDYQELPELFSGEAVFNLTGLELEDEEITFLAALGTKIPAAEVYVKIIHKGLFEAFKGQAPRRNPLERLSITAHGNTLLISSKVHSDVLVQGKANNPVDETMQNALKKGLFTLLLNFSKVQEELRDAQEELDGDEELEFIVNRILPHLKEIQIKAKQPNTTQYQATFGLHFQNSKDQGLKTLTHLLADLFNPHHRHPTIRPKLLAAEARLQVDPDALRKAIAGTWSGNFLEEEDQTYYKVTVAPDGTQQYEEIYISKDGYSRHSDSGTWSLHGNTYKDYSKEGGLNFVATILEVNDSHLTYVDYFDIYDDEVEPTVENRVHPKYQLPKPPAGLKELDKEELVKELEIEEKPEPENNQLPAPPQESKETKIEEVVSINHVVANLAGKHRTRFLLVSFDLHGEGIEFKYLIKDHYTKIQQATIQYLSTIELKRINENPRIKLEIRKVLHKKLNALPEIGGKITTLDFTEFNIQ